MRVFYSRISTVDQNEERQLINTKDFDKVFIDKCSGKIPFFQRPKGSQIKSLIDSEILKHLEVHSIDRLGRNTLDVLKTWSELTELGITVVCRNPSLRNFKSNGTPDQVSELIISILSIMSKFERDQIKERQMEGIKIAKLKGKYRGRKVATYETVDKFLKKPKSIEIAKLLDKGRSYYEIRKIAKCSPSTIKKVKSLTNNKFSTS